MALTSATTPLRRRHRPGRLNGRRPRSPMLPTTPPPVPHPPTSTGPVYLPAAKVKLKKVKGGTSVVKGKGAVFGTRGKLVRYTVEVQTKMRRELRAVQLEAVTRWAFGERARLDRQGQRRLQRWTTQGREDPHPARTPVRGRQPLSQGRLAHRRQVVVLQRPQVRGIEQHALAIGSTRGFPSLDEYRAYLVNHEVGHGLGYKHRDVQEGCAREGDAPAVARLLRLPSKRLALPGEGRLGFTADGGRLNSMADRCNRRCLPDLYR